MLNQVAHLVLVAYVDLRLPPTWYMRHSASMSWCWKLAKSRLSSCNKAQHANMVDPFNVNSGIFRTNWRSIPWLPMSCLLTPPGHQQPQYLSWINGSLSSTRNNLDYLSHLSVDKWHKILFMVSENISAHKELTHWGRDKMNTISQTTFQAHFHEWKCLNSDWNFTEVCS